MTAKDYYTIKWFVMAGVFMGLHPILIVHKAETNDEYLVPFASLQICVLLYLGLLVPEAIVHAWANERWNWLVALIVFPLAAAVAYRLADFGPDRRRRWRRGEVQHVRNHGAGDGRGA